MGLFGWLIRRKKKRKESPYTRWVVWYNDKEGEIPIGKVTGTEAEAWDSAQALMVNWVWKNRSLNEGVAVFGNYTIVPDTEDSQ